MADSKTQRIMMVDTQVRPSDVTSFPIIEAMLTVERENFVPPAARQTAYVDGPIPLAKNRTLLEPRTFAKMLEAMDIQPDELVLDVGAGLGYSAAVIARLAEAVVALEEEDSLASEAESALSAAEVDNVAVMRGPLAEGAAALGPYDVIVIEGGVEFVPQALLDQVKEGGRIGAIFMDGALGTFRVGCKVEGKVSWRDAFNATAQLLPGFVRERAFQL